MRLLNMTIVVCTWRICFAFCRSAQYFPHWLVYIFSVRSLLSAVVLRGISRVMPNYEIRSITGELTGGKNKRYAEAAG